MSTNRLFNLFIAVALLVVAVLLVREANATATVSEMDSATRSYIAWGEAMRARNAIDSGTRSYIAWGKALERAKLNALDSGTRSYIAWGEALEAAGKLHNPGARSDFSHLRENKAAPASYHPPLDECFDVPLREIVQCREASQ